MKEYKVLTEKADKMINRLINVSRKFCKTCCIPDGLYNNLRYYLATGTLDDTTLYDTRMSFDYDYFGFTKSTKSLLAVKRLLNDTDYNFNEDSFMQIRSIFENHIMTRYVREHIDIESERVSIIKKFIINPLSVQFNYFSLEGNTIHDNVGNKVGKITMPHSFLMGKDKLYYSKLYQFLCQYTHCSFGAMICYYGEKHFMYDKDNFRLMTRLLAIFVFTKIYEGVVTVNGEDLGDKKEEQSYYNLAYDSLELQYTLFDFLINFYANKSKNKINILLEKYLGDGTYDTLNESIEEMLILMRDSLLDCEIGSLNKETLNTDNKFTRYYPKYE